MIALEKDALRATRERGLARAAFTDASRIVHALAMQLQKARHGRVGDSEQAIERRFID